MCYEHFAIQLLIHHFSYFGERRRIKYHFMGYAGEPCYVVWNVATRVDQGVKAVGNLCAIMVIDCYFRDTVLVRISPRGFNVYYSVHVISSFPSQFLLVF